MHWPNRHYRKKIKEIKILRNQFNMPLVIPNKFQQFNAKHTTKVRYLMQSTQRSLNERPK